MTPFGDWVPPWRKGLPQARCAHGACTPDMAPGLLCVAVTLDANGWCAQCRRSPDEARILPVGNIGPATRERPGPGHQERA